MSGNIITKYLEKRRKAQVYSPAEKFGELLMKKLKEDRHFYFFSPNETTSNRFDAVFDVEKRAWNLPKESWDLPESKNGHIVEMLSENVLFSVMTGHLMNGEQAMMGSYEAFFTVAASQILQQIKFIKQTKQTEWRKPLPAVNLLSTSTCWRQDHNGFTHQSPALISTLLSVPSNLVNCLFPVDDISVKDTFDFMLKSKNVVNLTTFNKHPEPRFLDRKKSEEQFKNHGVVILDEFSDEDPDIILAGVGDIPTQEIVAAIRIIKDDVPSIKIRCININALSYRAIGISTNKLGKKEFAEYFTADKPIVACFHGYPETFENILENYTERKRLRVHGFIEEGSTTTPFEMLRRNGASRYDIAISVASALRQTGLVETYKQELANNHNYAVKYGEDLFD